ncbi:hypothetical protein CROQUDRAFT_654017, partial [Cronartium quercuum f. sp. fusiforme G11]
DSVLTVFHARKFPVHIRSPSLITREHLICDRMTDLDFIFFFSIIRVILFVSVVLKVESEN